MNELVKNVNESAKFECSLLLISGCRFKITAGKEIELTEEFITIPIDKGNETIIVSLSFKHVKKVEFLDNNEAKGAGIILYINDFMTKKLQDLLDEGGTKLLDFKTCYSDDRFIVLDILNSDSKNLNRINNILYKAGMFHHNYIIKQMNSKNKKAKIDIPHQFFSIIAHCQWVAVFSLLGIDIMKSNHANGYSSEKKLNGQENQSSNKISDINVTSIPSNRPFNLPPNIDQKMTVGNYVRLNQIPDPGLPVNSSNLPINAYINQDNDMKIQTMISQPTARIIQNIIGIPRPPTIFYSGNDPSTNINPLIYSATTSHAQQFFISQQKQDSILLDPNTSQNIVIFEPTFQGQIKKNIEKKSKISEIGKQNLKQKPKHEIHLLEDDESEPKPSVSKDENEIVVSYPPNSKDTCSVHYADLKYLTIDVMLNDTIIDFYLKYIHHSLIPIERRDSIFIFTTFFFARLTQAPAHGKQQITMATKLKRVTTNFQSLKNWTKKVDLFAKDYIVVPINEDIHWYLAIIVKPRAAIYSTITKNPIIMEPGENSIDKPYIIVFNSLIDPALDKHIEVRNQLAEYLYLEYKDKHQSKCSSNDNKMFVKEALQVVQPLLIPQQKGYIDCGLFLLHFAEIFLTQPPKIINDKVCFHHWFPDFQIRNKRDQIKEVIRILSPKLKHSDFIYYPPPKNFNNQRKSKRQQQSTLENFQFIRRERRQSDSVINEIQKDPRFSILKRHRSLDSLLKENKEKPLVLQPPTIYEMKRYKKQKMRC